jgi:hypothetical protein
MGFHLPFPVCSRWLPKMTAQVPDRPQLLTSVAPVRFTQTAPPLLPRAGALWCVALAMLTAAKDAQPRRRSVLDHALANEAVIEYHPVEQVPE